MSRVGGSRPHVASPASRDVTEFRLDLSWIVPHDASRPVALLLLAVTITASVLLGLAVWGVPVVSAVWPGLAILERAAIRVAGRQHLVNLLVTNVPGPPTPLYLGPARVLELFPVVPLVGNLSLAVGALSYAGQLNLTVVADTQQCPDVPAFAEGPRDSLRRFTHLPRAAEH